MKDEKLKESKTYKLAIIALIVAVIVALGCLALGKTGISLGKQNQKENNQLNKNEYQAVFLTNGQVYFGKLTDDGGNYVKLTDIYYLQNQNQNKVQPKDPNANSQSNLSLIKLGKELHAPEDMMEISRQQVLFWENIQNNGKVAQAIKDYKAGNK